MNDPTTWQDPLRAIAQYEFQATSPQELSFSPNQVITIAPQHLQGQLWNSGWLMGTTDRQHAGLVPVNYIKVIKPASDSQCQNTSDKEANMADVNKHYNGEEL